VIRLVRFVKWGLFLISVGWAVHADNVFIFLAKTFPSPGPAEYGLSELLASLQGYTVVFGPVVIAAIFLMVRWPEGSKK